MEIKLLDNYLGKLLASTHRTSDCLWPYARVARVVIRGWTSGKHEEYWQSIHGQRKAKDFLKRLSAKRAKELLNLRQNPLKIMTGLLTGHCPLKRYLLKL